MASGRAPPRDRTVASRRARTTPTRPTVSAAREHRRRASAAPSSAASALCSGLRRIPSYPPSRNRRNARATRSLEAFHQRSIFFQPRTEAPWCVFFRRALFAPPDASRVLHTVHPSSFISSHRVARRTARRPAPLGLIPEKKQKRNRNGNVRVSSPLTFRAGSGFFTTSSPRARGRRTEVRSPARPIRNSSSSKSSSGNRSKRSVTGRSPSSRNAPRMRSNGAASTNHLRRISPFVA